MKVVEINSCAYGSTGKIMLQIADSLKELFDIYVCYPNGRHNKRQKTKNTIHIGGRFSQDLHLILDRFTGFNGCFSVFSTFLFISRLKRIAPDIIHLHNLHNCYINLPMLFNYIKRNHINVVWTLHDCWAFTGHCPHFDIAECNRWKSQCFDCVQYKKYPASYIDRSKTMYSLKKKWFTGVENMAIVTPSKWLADIVKKSFLGNYPIKIINNGIDLSIFKPTYSDFRKKYHCESKFILLGVSFSWGCKKGLDVFIELSKLLDERFKIVLVGTNDIIDKELPQNIISIHKTHDQTALAKIYTAADLFVNPTREDNFPTVNIESLACGTPVITFSTGGSPEIIDPSCGVVIKKDDIKALRNEIIRISEEQPFSEEKCINRAKNFDGNLCLQKYGKLYEGAQ